MGQTSRIPAMKIAILGTRGIPANYGGFETFAEELAIRLTARGHDVTVYGRKGFSLPFAIESDWRDITTICTPTVFSKYLETPLHSITSFLDLFRRQIDVAILCNAANSPFAWLGIMRGCPLLINVDGIERERKKWNSLGRLWYRLGEWCSVRFATRVIADAGVISDYYRARFHITPEVIAYGAEAQPLPPGPVLRNFNLQPNNYLLYVSRLEPENNALGVIEAYRHSGLSLPLVIVGDAPYADEYKAKLRAIAGTGVVFTGFQFGDAYRELRSHCLAYVQATEVGGTHPALVEAMAYGNCIIANGTPENYEVLGEAGLFYRKNDFNELSKLLIDVVSNEVLRSRLSEQAKRRAEERYSWDLVTTQYEMLCSEVFGLLQGRGDATPQHPSPK
jgi:glycosyltransferase involved in cell wall biosynthesis